MSDPGQPAKGVPALVSVTDAARVLGRSAKTVRRRIAAGALPAVLENGRTMVRADELAAYIDGLERPAAGARPLRRRPAGPPRGVYEFLNG